jgi:hypothetical protein
VTPLPAPTARTPSMPRLRPTRSDVGPSASCLASSALTMLLCLDMLFARPPSCPAFPQMGFASPSSRGPCTRPQRYYAGSDSSPARTRRRGLSVPFACLPGIPSPTTYCIPRVTFSPPRAPAGPYGPGFALHEQARRCTPPNRVRSPTGCRFASGCSPPRLPHSRSRTTQLPSATCAVTSHGTDSHYADIAN